LSHSQLLKRCRSIWTSALSHSRHQVLGPKQDVPAPISSPTRARMTMPTSSAEESTAQPAGKYSDERDDGVHAVPNAGDSQLVLGGSLRARGASQSAEAASWCVTALSSTSWASTRRENGFDSTLECMELTGQTLSLKSSLNQLSIRSEVNSVPASTIHPSPLTPLLKCAPHHSCLKRSEQNRRSGNRNKATLCEDAVWILIDDSAPGELPVQEARPIREDGYTQKLAPRSLLQAQLTIVDGDPFLLGEQMDLPRCTSFEACTESSSDLPWFHNSRSGSPIALKAGVSVRESPSFPCACSSVSTAEEWSRPIYVE